MPRTPSHIETCLPLPPHSAQDDLHTDTATPFRAYEDQAFIHSADARSLRVLAELLEPGYRLDRYEVRDTVAFFGSARATAADTLGTAGEGAGILDRYYEDARELSRRLTLWGELHPHLPRFLVASGGGPGIMEAVHRGASDAGGRSVAMAIELSTHEPLSQYATPELTFLFHYFFMRKFWFLYTAKAFVFFPGGFGTLDELAEVLTLIQTGKLHKRVGLLLYGSEYWHSILNFEAMRERGVISERDLDLIRFADTVEDAECQLLEFVEANYGKPTIVDATGLTGTAK
jgi:uncharacterized protein (TIGR00730 family)